MLARFNISFANHFCSSKISIEVLFCPIEYCVDVVPMEDVTVRLGYVAYGVIINGSCLECGGFSDTFL